MVIWGMVYYVLFTHMYGGFLKWGYPQIIHFNRIFHELNQPFWGFPIYGNSGAKPPGSANACDEEFFKAIGGLTKLDV